MRKFMYIAAALLVLVGCNKKDNSIENTPQEVVTIKGSIVLPQTPNKIAPAEDWQSANTPFDMLWEEGDQIYIFNEGGGETFTLTEGAGTTIGTFSGTKLANMSEYYVVNVGQTGVGEYTVEYIENNFSHPYIFGMGNENGFNIYNFGAVLGLPLKGDVTLSKIEVETFEGKNQPLSTFTMSFEEGLELNNTTATMVYFPVDASELITIETINFYVDEELIMSKTLSEEKGNLPGYNKVTTYPELEVKVVVEWTNALELGKESATAIVIETGKDVRSYTADGTHQMLDEDGFLWAYLDGTTLRIQTPASPINTSLDELFKEYKIVVSISGLGHIHATTAKEMFKECEMLSNIDFTGFNTEDVTNMSGMFSFCSALESLNLSRFNTANVMDMGNMFSSCTGLGSLTLSNDFKVASNKSGMFGGCGTTTYGGCTVYGVTDESIKAALSANNTGWDNNYMSFQYLD